MSKSIKHFDDEAKYVGVQKERFFYLYGRPNLVVVSKQLLFG
jgi:hypothetical protein